VSLDSQSSGSLLSRRRLQNTADVFGNGTYSNGTFINETLSSADVLLNETNLNRGKVFTITGEFGGFHFCFKTTPYFSFRSSPNGTIGTCRGCPVSESGHFNLFDDAFRRRRRKLRVSDAAQTSSQRKLQDDQGLCICPIGIEPVEANMGPSVDEFKEVFNTKIEEEVEGGLLGGLNVTVEDVVEGHIVDCEPTETEFRSEIFSDLQVNLTSLTVEEVAILEQGNERSCRHP
jgi:hypothetical protein